MADDRRQPPDSTAPMNRVGDDDDATRVRPALGPDATRTGSEIGPDATRVHPDRVRATYEDSTRVTPAGEDLSDRWAARAAVPPAGAAPPGTYEYELEPAPDDQPNWLRPLLFGIVGLLLLGALLTGVWLIYTADNEPPAAQPSAPPATSAAPATTTVTTAPPTSAAPPTSEEPFVVVPAELIGLSEDEARQRLTDAGLRVQVTRRTDATMAPGTVLEVSPGPGSEVPPNTVVRIVVAEAPEPPTTRPPSDDDD
jgi:PASTA domain